MRRIFCLLLALLMSCNAMLIFSACTPLSEQKTEAPSFDSVLSKSCSEIIDYVYQNAEQTEKITNALENLENREITAENCEWFLGVPNVPFESGTASESMISPADYSFCVIKVKDGEDPENVKKTIEENIRPDKWVCMGAEVAYTIRNKNVIAVILADKATAGSVKSVFMSLN